MYLRYADHCSSESLIQLIENTVAFLPYITKVMSFTSSCNFMIFKTINQLIILSNHFINYEPVVTVITDIKESIIINC